MRSTLSFLAAAALLACSGGSDPSPAPPAAPASLDAVAGVESVTLTWPSVEGATSYDLLWSNAYGLTVENGTRVTGVESPYVFEGATGGRPYHFLVVAVGSAGESGPSPQAMATPKYKVVFFTSVTGTGDLSSWADPGGLTGLAAADAICQARADAAGLPGTFRAWLSDSTDDAYCRVQGLSGKKSASCGQATLPSDAGGWGRADGEPFAPPLDELATATGEVYRPARLDELGNPAPTDRLFFTATTYDGDYSPDSCSDWTSAGAGTAVSGDSWGGTYAWTLTGNLDCSSLSPLLCMQLGPRRPIWFEPALGRLVFASSVSGSGISPPGRTRAGRRASPPATRSAVPSPPRRSCRTRRRSRPGSRTAPRAPSTASRATGRGCGSTGSRWRTRGALTATLNITEWAQRLGPVLARVDGHRPVRPRHGGDLRRLDERGRRRHGDVRDRHVRGPAVDVLHHGAVLRADAAVLPRGLSRLARSPSLPPEAEERTA